MTSFFSKTIVKNREAFFAIYNIICLILSMLYTMYLEENAIFFNLEVLVVRF